MVRSSGGYPKDVAKCVFVYQVFGRKQPNRLFLVFSLDITFTLIDDFGILGLSLFSEATKHLIKTIM